MDLTTLLTIIFVCIVCLTGGVAVGYWLWGTTPDQVEELKEEHAQYKDDVNSHMSQMLTAVDDLRLQIRRSASDLGDPVLDGKLERVEGEQTALEAAMPVPPLALDTEAPVAPIASADPVEAVAEVADAPTDAPTDESKTVGDDEAQTGDTESQVAETEAAETDIKDAKPAVKAS